MLYYYFLTIDYCKTSAGEPTKDMYRNAYRYQKELFDLEFTNQNYPIQSYEYKKKNMKYREWLHYHCIVETKHIVDYTISRYIGYSIKYVRINTIEEMATYSGYVVKDKIDIIDVNKYNCW